jgi:N-methylhydantoinase B/acetone carboxylase alpha subunit
VLDETATAKKRAEIRDTRLARSVPVRDWIAAEKKRVEAAGFIAPVKKMYQESMSLSPKWADKFRKFWGLRDGWMPGTGT